MFENIVDKGQSGKLKAGLSHLANVYVSSYRPSQNDIKTLRILKRSTKEQEHCHIKTRQGKWCGHLGQSDVRQQHFGHYLRQL